METIVTTSTREKVRTAKKLIKSVGNSIGSVHFVKRSDSKLRKMAYRLHVKNPSYARKPTGQKVKSMINKDENNNQVTVFDVNKITYDIKGKMNGRGAWRSIPLENVKRVKVGGIIYKFV
jgi:predicted HAD superfamily phosphohydrolase YqeG